MWWWHLNWQPRCLRAWVSEVLLSHRSLVKCGWSYGWFLKCCDGVWVWCLLKLYSKWKWSLFKAYFLSTVFYRFIIQEKETMGFYGRMRGIPIQVPFLRIIQKHCVVYPFYFGFPKIFHRLKNSTSLNVVQTWDSNSFRLFQFFGKPILLGYNTNWYHFSGKSFFNSFLASSIFSVLNMSWGD